MNNNYQRTKFACYAAYFTMSSIFCVPPILFVTFRESFGLSYTFLGSLVFINFCTQLGIDLIFTIFSKYFNTKIAVRVMPVITSAGLAVYALVPMFFPDIAYVGLVIGTVLFSVSAGLSEVLLSPVIAVIPSKDPQRDMSLLHSLYAFGVFSMVLFSTVFLKLFGSDRWMYLILILAALPLIAAVLFWTSPIPDINRSDSSGEGVNGTKKRAIGLVICVACIFFGSCAENAMSSWISSFMENALRIDKAVGDLLGVAMFAILLGIARISYAKFGKNICRVLLVGMIGAAACYLVAALSPNVFISFLACVFTGFCTSMLWPGTLIMMEEKIHGAGVAAFALMAAGGDLGASVAPQLLGVVVDSVSVSSFGISLAEKLGSTPEQIGLRSGILICSVFPIIGTVLVLVAIRFFNRVAKKEK